MNTGVRNILFKVRINFYTIISTTLYIISIIHDIQIYVSHFIPAGRSVYPTCTLYRYLNIFLTLCVVGIVKPQKMMASDQSESILDFMKVYPYYGRVMVPRCIFPHKIPNLKMETFFFNWYLVNIQQELYNKFDHSRLYLIIIFKEWLKYSLVKCIGLYKIHSQCYHRQTH